MFEISGNSKKIFIVWKKKFGLPWQPRRGLCGVIFTGLVTSPVQLLQNLHTRVLQQGGPSLAGSAPPSPICCWSSFLCHCCNRIKEANSSKVSNMKYNSSRLILIFQIKRGKRLLASNSQIFIKMWSRTSLGVQWLGLWAPNAGDLGSISGQGTRSHMLPLWVDMSHWRSYILQQRLKTLFAAAKIQRSQNKYKILLKYSLFTILFLISAV